MFICAAILASACGLPAAGEAVAPGYGGFRVRLQNESDGWTVVYSDRQLDDVPVGPKQSEEVDWFGTRNPVDEGGNEKTARIEAYRLAGTPPRSGATAEFSRGELIFCRDFTFRELLPLDWTIKVVPGEVRCEPRRFPGLPDSPNPASRSPIGAPGRDHDTEELITSKA